MSVDIRLERLYDRIELVQGAGSRSRARLCIMSFVAYLAGEPHGDNPAVASAFIRNVAIQLNDSVPSIFRQELKPFAPRIIGTNDGQDLIRAEAMYEMIRDDILPRMELDFPGDLMDQPLKLWSAVAFDTWTGLGGPSCCLTSLVRRFHLEHESRDFLFMGRTAGALLATLARVAQTPAAQRWYWSKALEMLDRLCDIGAEHRPVPTWELDGLSERLDAQANVPTPCEAVAKDTAVAKQAFLRRWAAVRDLVST